MRTRPVQFDCVKEATALVLGILLLAVPACREESEPAKAAPKFEIDKQYERGPVTFRVRVDRKEATIADHIRLVLEADAEEAYEVELPKFGDKLEQFVIVDYSAPPPRLVDDGKMRYQKRYELEPFLSGDYKIPPMKVTFRKKDEKGAKAHEVLSEEITIKVRSLLPEDAAKLEIRDIAPPVEIPATPRLRLYVGVALMAFGLVGLAGFILWRARRRQVEQWVASLLAHEIAYTALQQLIAEDLIEKGQAKLFYLRLSGILRHYIENRFGLRAPEQTTEEFLTAMGVTGALEERHKAWLAEFLEHCDLVKFAEYPPTDEDIQRTFDICKQFVLETESEAAEQPAAVAV